ncbi:MAG: hypothetical protein ACFB4J_00295 [Elainellaceae cyanobacterium]
MSAIPNQRLQRLHQCGYAFIGAGTFMLLSWVNPLGGSLDGLQGGAVFLALVVGLGAYRRLKQGSKTSGSK